MSHLRNYLGAIILFCTTLFCSQAKTMHHKLAADSVSIIKGLYKGFEGDSLFLTYSPIGYPLGEKVKLPRSKKRCVVNNKSEFYFEIKIDTMAYVELTHKLKNGAQKVIFTNYLAERGDDINITIETDTSDIQMHGNYAVFKQDLTFFGKGADKYRCKNDLDQNERKNIFRYQNESNKTIYKNLIDRFRNSIYQMNFINSGADSTIDGFQTRVSPLVYQLLKADQTAKKKKMIYRQLNIHSDQVNALDTIEKKQFKILYEEYIKPETLTFPEDVKISSALYPSFILNKLTFESKFLYHQNILNLIPQKYTSNLKERLLTEHILNNYERISNVGLLVDSLKVAFSNVLYKDLLNSTKHNKGVGAKMIDFELPQADGRLVKLSNYLGKVVFVDFWFTGCGGCSIYYKSIVSKVEKLYERNLDVVFITISIDINKDKWIKSIESENYTSPKVVNLYTNGQGTDHPVIEQLGVFSYPRPMLIGRDGKIYSNNIAELRTSVSVLSGKIDEALKFPNGK